MGWVHPLTQRWNLLPARVHGNNLRAGGTQMRNELTAIFEKDGEWYIAYCPEVPDANGQGRTKEECRRNLADAIALILEDRREDSFTTPN